jgi:myosin heavy subunit
MKIRISLIIAIVAALTITSLSLLKVRGRITSLQASLKEQTTARTKAETDLAGTKGDLERVNGVLRQTTAALETAKAENQALTATVESRTKQVKQLNQELASLQLKHDNAAAQLAAYESVMTIQQAISAGKQIKSLQTELTAVTEERKLLAQKVDRLLAKYGEVPVELPIGFEGKVLATDPKWRFVILDAGQTQGALERGELLVSREGKLVGKVAIRRVEKNQCVADVLPGWNLGEIKEGDKFIAAHVSADL